MDYDPACSETILASAPPVRMGRARMILGGFLLLLASVGMAREAAPLPEPGRLEAHVRHLSLRCSPRTWKHPGNLDKAATYVEEALRVRGAKVTRQVFQVQGRSYRNVLGRFGPEQGRVVVIGAHYDAFGDSPGADDNASGVSGLLELATLLQAEPPRVPVILAAYVLEEPPFFRSPDMGSARHATQLKGEGVAVRAMLSLDMIGCYGPASSAERSISVVGRPDSAVLANLIQHALREGSGLDVQLFCGPKVPGADWSDHLSFWNAGFPAVMVNDCMEREDDAYHTKRDRPDRLDFSRMARLIKGVRAAIERL